jgi:hypothetical protein
MVRTRLTSSGLSTGGSFSGSLICQTSAARSVRAAATRRAEARVAQVPARSLPTVPEYELRSRLEISGSRKPSHRRTRLPIPGRNECLPEARGSSADSGDLAPSPGHAPRRHSPRNRPPCNICGWPSAETRRACGVQATPAHCRAAACDRGRRRPWDKAECRARSCGAITRSASNAQHV